MQDAPVNKIKTDSMADGERIIPVNIEEEMKSSYIDYSMSVSFHGPFLTYAMV